jgi:hypothetical protein
VELQQVLREADPAAVLVAPHILDRIIQQAFALPRVVWTVPHRKSFIVDRQLLFQHVDQAELAVAPDLLIPSTVILLAYPSLEDLNDQQEPLLLKYWRRLFHASVHKTLEERCKNGTLTAEGIRQRVEAIGRTEFEEIRTVLTQDDYLPAEADERMVYTEFVAVFLELEFFCSNLLGAYFPGIRDQKEVSALLARDVDGAALFRSTRLAGAPNPVIRTASNAEEAHEFYWKLIQGADRAAAAGNTVRAAILRRKAARVAPGGKGASTQADSVNELDGLTRRLQAALQLTDADAAEWQKDLPKLLDKADQGSNAVEAALLFDLQKICFDHEQDIYALDLMEWVTSGFRRPIKRPLPSLRVVRVTRHLRSAVQRLTMARLSDDDRQHLDRLLEAALRQSEDRLRTRFRPIVRDSLLDAGLSPCNAPEETAFSKMVEEMLDHISSHGFLTFSDLRDVIARNQLKLPDLQDPQDFIRGDQLLRLDRRLSTLLDGVYKPSELYLRWLERFAALNFGTAAGRWLTQYVSIPFVIAFLILFAGKLIFNDIRAWTSHQLAPKVSLADGPFEDSKALDARRGPGVLDGRDRFSQTPLTVEMWVRLFGKGTGNVLASYDRSSPVYWQFKTQPVTGWPVVTLGGADQVELVDKQDICNGAWHYLALTCDGKNASLHVDGKVALQAVDGKPVAEVPFKARSGMPSFQPLLVVGAVSPHDRRGMCDGLVADLRISKSARTIEGKPAEPFDFDDQTIALCRFDTPILIWEKTQTEATAWQEVDFLTSWQFWVIWLLTGGMTLALLQSAHLRGRIAALARAGWRPVRALFLEVPRWVIEMPIIRRIAESWAFQLAYWYLALPALLAVPFYYLVHPLLDRMDHSAGVSAVVAFIMAFILVNARFGQAAQALLKQTAIWTFELFRSGFIPGLVHLLALVFKEIRDLVETVIFTVDEWLRFRKGESTLSMVVRTLLGAVWFPFSYVLRFYFVVLIEPCINPPKLAISSIMAKIIYPLLIIVGVYRWMEAPWFDLWAANILAKWFVWTTVWLLPDAFAFLLWEMKENYRLYRANRSPTLKPVAVGVHGETVRGLLQPGFHSGTIPRLYRRLRWAERKAFQTGSWRSVRICLQSLQEVAVAVERFVERDFVHLLWQGPGWKEGSVRTGQVHLASNRISVELLYPPHQQPVCLEFEFWSGWLVAGIREPGWLLDLDLEQRQTLTMALAGLYKLAGIDLVREQVRKTLPEEIKHYDLTTDGLLLWQGRDREHGMKYALREQPAPLFHQPAITAVPAPALDARRILFSRQPLPWDRWVHSWEKNGHANGQSLFDEPIAFLPTTISPPPPANGQATAIAIAT